MKVTIFFFSLQAINYFVAYIYYWMKAEFQLGITGNKVVVFSTSKLTGPLKCIHGLPRVRGPQVKNGWLTRISLMCFSKNLLRITVLPTRTQNMLTHSN